MPKKAFGVFAHGLSSWLKRPCLETKLAHWRRVQTTCLRKAEHAAAKVDAILASLRGIA